MINKDKEIQEVNFSSVQISEVIQDDVVAIKIAASGAMGEPGGVLIFMQQKNKIRVISGNYAYGEFDLDAFLKFMKDKQGKSFLSYFMKDEVPKGWNHIYMGMGNNLYVRDSYYEKLEKKYESMLETEIYCEFYRDLICLMQLGYLPVAEDLRIDEYKRLCDYVKRAYNEIEVANELLYAGQDKTYMKSYSLCDEINLWSYWQGRGVYHPNIMLIGQDWGCPFSSKNAGIVERIYKCKTQPVNPEEDRTCYYFDDLNENSFVFKTDTNLAELFRSLDMGYDDLLHVRYDDLFFTNVCLGYRSNGNSGNFKKSWIAEVEKYVYPKLIDVLQPKVIICLGKETYESFLKTMEVKDSRDRSDYNQFIEANNLKPYEIKNIPIFAFAHCGSMGTLNRNNGENSSLDIQKSDWGHIKKYLKN